MLITGFEPKSTGSPTLSVGTVLVQCKGTFSSQLRNMVLRFYFPERRSGIQIGRELAVFRFAI